MWKERALEAGVGVAALLSAGLLAVMLAAPWLPRPATATLPLPSATTVPTASTDEVAPPIGLYLLRGPFSFGPCLAMELTPRSYPVADGAEGAATIMTWQRGMTGCDARSDEIATINASVSRVLSEGADAHVVAYAVRFRLPVEEGGVDTAVEISILAAQSTPQLLQALETSTPGSQGLVFDRVSSVEPTLNPLPSATPAPEVSTGGPAGLYLLRGPLIENVCIAVNLAEVSYPPDPTAEGTAVVRWWEHGPSAPDDPAACLSRTGAVQEVRATVMPSWNASVPSGPPDSHAIGFMVPVAGEDREFRMAIIAAESNRDELAALLLTETGVHELGFDRVDSIDPPLVPGPTPMPSP